MILRAGIRHEIQLRVLGVRGGETGEWDSLQLVRASRVVHVNGREAAGQQLTALATAADVFQVEHVVGRAS